MEFLPPNDCLRPLTTVSANSKRVAPVTMLSKAMLHFFSPAGWKEVCICLGGWGARRDRNLRGRRGRGSSTRSARRRLQEPPCSPEFLFASRSVSLPGRELDWPEMSRRSRLAIDGSPTNSAPQNSRRERCRRARSRNFRRKCRRETNNSRTPRGHVASSFPRRGMVVQWVGTIGLLHQRVS